MLDVDDYGIMILQGEQTHYAWEQFPPMNVDWITPSTAKIFFASEFSRTVVTLGTWSQIFDPSVGSRACFSATICS